MNPGEGVDLKLVVEQSEPHLGDVPVNRRRVAEAVADAGDADLVVFPELNLTGYSLEGRARELALDLDEAPPLTLPPGSPDALVGLVEAGSGGALYNSAVLVREDRVVARHRKVYLPSYGIFREGRTFTPGPGPLEIFDLAPGWRVGILVCEDLWHPALPYLLALRGADVLLVPASAPGREPRGEGADLRFLSAEPWEILSRAAAFNHGVWLVVANRAGREGELVFAGGSLVVAPDGEVVARGAHGRPDRLEVLLSRDRLRNARNPFSHLREEDPAFTARELRRILGERPPSEPRDGAPHLDL